MKHLVFKCFEFGICLKFLFSLNITLSSFHFFFLYCPPALIRDLSNVIISIIFQPTKDIARYLKRKFILKSFYLLLFIIYYYSLSIYLRKFQTFSGKGLIIETIKAENHTSHSFYVFHVLISFQLFKMHELHFMHH